MKQKIIRLIVVALLITVPQLSFAQFQKLYDYDSSYDWGWNIFLQADGNYFIEGGMQPTGTEDWGIFNMSISADGNTIISKHLIQYNLTSLFDGNPGEIKSFPGGYLSPLQILQPHGTYPSGRAGLIKYNLDGDTIFFKTYTDTPTYFESIIACGIMPDGGYIGGGGRSYDTPSYFDPLLLVRTDSMGDTQWTRAYQKIDTQASIVNNVIPLADGRIVVAARSVNIVETPSGGFYDNAPWFLVIDSMGNIQKDTLYSSTYLVGENCGELYSDMNGGYINIGALDVYDPTDIDALSNFPGYIAHLDTNFRITWITNFTYTAAYGLRQAVMVRQLQDSSYVVAGEATGPYAPSTQGFAAKISKTGAIGWSNNYYSDVTQFAYFEDVVEKLDGSLVFVGKTFNDTCAVWKDDGDVWLVSTDSNGYVPPDTTLGVHMVPNPSNGMVKIFPNPTSGNFTINCPQQGVTMIYNVEGQDVAAYAVKGGSTLLQLPVGVSAGIYFCKYVPLDGMGAPVVVRLVYAP